MNITIREYQDRDLEGCKKLWRELTQHHRDIFSDPSIGGDDPGMHCEPYLQKTTLAGLWIAEKDSVLIGMAGLLIDEEEAEIEPIVIRTEFRSQGAGTSLIERLKTEGRQGWIDGVTIHGHAFRY